MQSYRAIDKAGWKTPTLTRVANTPDMPTSDPPPGEPRARVWVDMVLLRHDLPDGTHHHDWLIETTPGAEGLVSFRVGERIDGLAAGAVFEAQAMAPHRAAYLTYEGPVSGGRGEVRRVATGQASWRVAMTSSAGGAASLEVAWAKRDNAPRSLVRTHEYTGMAEADGVWRFTISAAELSARVSE